MSCIADKCALQMELHAVRQDMQNRIQCLETVKNLTTELESEKKSQELIKTLETLSCNVITAAIQAYRASVPAMQANDDVRRVSRVRLAQKQCILL